MQRSRITALALIASLFAISGWTSHATAAQWSPPSRHIERSIHGHIPQQHADDSLLRSVNDWLHSRWRLINGWAIYQQRTRPGAMLSLWLSRGVNRMLGAFSETGQGPMVGVAEFGVLTVTPVSGAESSGYGYRQHPILNRRKFHKGVDFKASRGTPVQAAGPGVVLVARRRGTYGRLVIVSHGLGLETRYAHLNRIDVNEGDFVPAGAVVGLVGSSGRTTGPHLHFEVRQFGQPVDPHWALGKVKSTLADELIAFIDWLVPKR